MISPPHENNWNVSSAASHVACIDVSVVVPTHRRNDLLNRCLAALVAQDISPDRFEIIVADDGGSPDTRSFVETWQSRARVPIHYIAVTPRGGPARARNEGWRRAGGTIIAFTDDDCIPDPSWLRAAIAAMNSGADALSGRVVMPLPDRPTDYERDAAGLATAEFVTANCFCRRAALQAVGGFDERFTMAWREDSDLQFSLLTRGFCIHKAPGAVVVHPIRPARFGVSLWQQRKSVFNCLLRRKHPQLCRQRITGFPAIYYPIVALLALSIIVLVRGQGMLAASTLIAWLGLVGWFCVKRLRGNSKSPRHIAEMALTSALIPVISFFWLIVGTLRYRVFAR
jgi:GT2 family glycosyltransferase